MRLNVFEGNQRKLNLLVIIAAFVLLASLLVLNAFAWFIKEKETDTGVEFGNFKVAVKVWFQGYGSADNPYEKPSDEPMEVSFEPSAANYWGNLRVAVEYTGIGEAYLRVLVLELWTESVYDEATGITTDYNLRWPITAYGLGTDWIDYRKPDAQNQSDMFIYYADKSVPQGEDPYAVSDEATKRISLVNSVPPFSVNNENVRLRIRIIAEAVQKNRFREIWGIESMPEMPI